MAGGRVGSLSSVADMHSHSAVNCNAVAVVTAHACLLSLRDLCTLWTEEMADEELRKAFSELQVKRMETTQMVAVAEGQRQALQRTITHCQLTCKELSSLPDSTPLYHSIGRMFLLGSKDEVRASLEANEASAKEKIAEIVKNVGHWEKAVKEQEDSLRELVSHKQKEK